MNILLREDEIRDFPDEIRNFLKSYLIEKLGDSIPKAEINKATPGIPKPRMLKDGFIQDGFVEAPSLTKHPERWLVIDKRFDWFLFLKMAASRRRKLRGLLRNDLVISLDKNRKPKFDFSGGIIDPNDSKSWGLCIIFCCMFGFGGKLDGFEKVKNTNELCDNLKKTGITKDEIIPVKSVGPLLKSITNQFRIECARQGDEVAVAAEDLHWFTFYKSTNEFYFAGDTENLCYEAAGKFTEEYFLNNISGR